MSNNNPNQIDITQLSGVANTNKLNITGISTFSQITNINNLPSTNNGGVDINNIDINKNYSQCESTLEFFIISLSKNLNINPKQSVALLSNNRKYLLRLFYKGIQNDFSLAIKWLKDINKNLQILQNLMINSTDNKNVFMTFSTLSVGLYSNNIDCVRITNTILSKLSIEIGTDWDWFFNEGYLSYIFCLEKNSIIKNKLLNGFTLHIKEHEDDIIKLFKDKFINEENITNNEYKDISNFIFNLLPLLSDNLEDKEKKFQYGILNLIIELIENNNNKIIDAPLLITMAAQAWNYCPDFFLENKNKKNVVLNFMKENIRTFGTFSNKYENLNINNASSISCLFHLLNNFGKIKNEDGPLIYKTLVFLFIEEYDDELIREFMLDNFSNFFLLNLKFPIDIFLSPYFKQIKLVKNISMADFNFIAVIIGHPRFTCEHALDLLDFILDISVSNLIFSKSANMLLNLIFSMKLLIKNKSVFEKAQTIFIQYINQMLNLYITNLKSNIIDNTILEFPYDILLEGFGDVNKEIESTLITTIDQYRSIKGVNSKPLLGLLWFFKSHDDVLLRLEEKYAPRPKKIEKSNKINNNKNSLKPINKSKVNNLNKKNEEDDINNVLKKSIDLALKKMKGEKEEKMKIKKEKIKKLELNKLKELKLKKNLEKELAQKNAEFNSKKQRADTFIDEANFSQMNLIQEEGSVISQTNNTFIRRPLSKTKLNTIMNYNNNNKNIFIVNISEEESREEKGIEAINIKYKSKLKNLVRILTDDSGNITKASILRYFRNKKITNSDLTLDELSLCVRQTFSANINLFDENQFKKLLVTISYLVMSKKRKNYSLFEAYYYFLKLIIDDLDVNINSKYKKYLNILKHLKNNLDIKTGEINVLLPPGFKIVQKTEIIQKSKIPKPMLRNFTESYVICLSLINDFISDILNEGVLEKYIKIKKIYDIEIELSMVHQWSENLMISYSFLPKYLEKYGIDAADALENGLKKLDLGGGQNKNKIGNYEREKLKKEQNIKLIEQKKEDFRKKRGKEIKTKVEQYKKEKEEKERMKKELEEKKKEEEQKAFHDMIKERKKINKKKKEEINKIKAKKEEEKKEKILEQQNKEKEDEKIHKEEQKKFLQEQNKKMKEQFKQLKQQKDDLIKKKQESLPENQKIPKNKINYFKEEKNYIEFDRNLISKLQTLMNSTNNISNYIKIYEQHLKLIFDIYHKIGQNKITSINLNIDDSLFINEYKEFLTNFGLLNILITKEQMNFIYNRLTRKGDKTENNNEKNSDEQKQYLTYSDFKMSFLLLTIISHLNNKEMKITEDDYNNILTIEKIEELFNYLGLKLPYIKKDLESLINSRRGMSAKDFFIWQQNQKKEFYDKFKGIERKNSITIPHNKQKRPKSSIKLNVTKNEKISSGNNNNINLKRVGSKDYIDERKNLSRKKIFKNDKVFDSTIKLNNNKANTLVKNNSKVSIKKNSFKINSNNIHNKNGSPKILKEKIIEKMNKNEKKKNNNSMNKNIKINNNKKEEVKNKITDNNKSKKDTTLENKNKIKKIESKDKIEEQSSITKDNTSNIIKNETDKKNSKEISNENSNLNTNKETNIIEDSPQKIDDNQKETNEIIEEDNTKQNNDININANKDKKILDNSDVSVVYDSPKKKDEENNNLINNDLNNEELKNEENVNKGYNMKIKTADGKEENWNIQA